MSASGDPRLAELVAGVGLAATLHELLEALGRWMRLPRAARAAGAAHLGAAPRAAAPKRPRPRAVEGAGMCRVGETSASSVLRLLRPVAATQRPTDGCEEDTRRAS